MKFKSSGYLIKEGIKSIWNNRMMSLASTHTSTISTVVSALPNLDNTESNFDVKRYEKSIRTESNIDISLPRM